MRVLLQLLALLLLCLPALSAEAKDDWRYSTAHGIEYQPEGGSYYARLKGFIQLDARNFFRESNVGDVEQTVIRSWRPTMDIGFSPSVSYHMLADLSGGETKVVESYLDWKSQSYVNWRLGEMKAPMGLERWQSEQELPFVERSMVSNLASSRDCGLMLYSNIPEAAFEYQLALTTSAPDGGEADITLGDGWDATARLFGHPFAGVDNHWVRYLGVGMAVSMGERNGSSLSPERTNGYRSQGQAKIFSYRQGTFPGDVAFADGTQWRVNPELYYQHGPFALLAEYLFNREEMRVGLHADTLSHDAFSVGVEYVLTGEDASFKGVIPRASFDAGRSQWGAWEVAARYGEMQMDNASFNGFADADRSVSAAFERQIGLNWYLSYHAKVNMTYSNTLFEGGAGIGDRPDEEVLMTRVQLRF